MQQRMPDATEHRFSQLPRFSYFLKSFGTNLARPSDESRVVLADSSRDARARQGYLTNKNKLHRYYIYSYRDFTATQHVGYFVCPKLYISRHKSTHAPVFIIILP